MLTKGTFRESLADVLADAGEDKVLAILHTMHRLGKVDDAKLGELIYAVKSSAKRPWVPVVD